VCVFHKGLKQLWLGSEDLSRTQGATPWRHHLGDAYGRAHRSCVRDRNRCCSRGAKPQNAGIPASAIRRYASSEVGRLDSEPVESTSPHTSGGGFWAWLFGEETTSETARSTYTHDVYERRSAAGNVVLSAVIDDDAKIHQAIAALEAHNPIDIDERSEDAGAPTASTLAPTTGPGTAGRDFSSSEVARDDMTDAPISSGRHSGD
jgi:hypothetical protein